MTQKFDFDKDYLEVLGEGAFCYAWERYDNISQAKYAVLEYKKDLSSFEEWLTLQRNAKLISRVVKEELDSNKFIIPQIFHINEVSDNPYVVMELCKKPPQEEVKALSKQHYFTIVEFLNSLHQIPINKVKHLSQHNKFGFDSLYKRRSFLMDVCGLELLQDEVMNCNNKKVLCHNDFSSKNFSINKNNQLIIYDWDMARPGLLASDFRALMMHGDIKNTDLCIQYYNALPKLNPNVKLHVMSKVFEVLRCLDNSVASCDNIRATPQQIHNAKNMTANYLIESQKTLAHYGLDKASKKITGRVLREVKDLPKFLNSRRNYNNAKPNLS